MTSYSPEPSIDNRSMAHSDKSKLLAFVKSPLFIAAIFLVGIGIGFLFGFGVAGIFYGRPGGATSKTEVQAAKPKPAVSEDSNKPQTRDANAPGYAEKIEIINAKAKHGQTYIGQNGAAVDLKVKNTGDRTINDLVITVFFLDSAGNAVHEDDFPLASSDGTAQTIASLNHWDLSPIKPNYIRQRNGVMSLNVPAEWKVGAISAKIKSVTVK